MNNKTMYSIERLEEDVGLIFKKCGVIDDAAEAIARVISAGERDGCKSHGIYRIEGCLRVLQAGKVSPQAVPEIEAGDGPMVKVDAKGGFASLAYEKGVPLLIERAQAHGLAALVINDCLHFSALWYEVEDIASRGLVALSMCPSYAVMAPWGGKQPLLGTNPFAFAWPRKGVEPYVFDFATTVAARGEIELHRREGRPLPEGWAVDNAGQPTTDPDAALAGAMLPFGQHKGSAIATMIELLAGPMLGDFTSQEALDFMHGDTSLLPRHGALVLAFDPQVFSHGRHRDPMAGGEQLLQGIVNQGARLPSQRRYEARREAVSDGIKLSEEEVALLERLKSKGLDALTP